MKKQHPKLLIIIACVSLYSCQSTSQDIKENDKKITALEEAMNSLKFQIANIEQDNTISKKLMASMQNDLQSQNEEIATQKKNIDILKRGLRSGIFEELPEDKKTNTTEKNENMTMLPDFVNGRSKFTENSETIKSTASDTNETKEDPIGPKELLANAEIKIRKSEFKEGLLKLDELKKKFPNFDDNGRSFLLAAEAWLKLKEYNNVIPEIRNFYLKYPTSAELAYAKLLEGQATEGNGSFEKAATLYNEVISLSPQSTLAQSARDGMLRMRDQK